MNKQSGGEPIKPQDGGEGNVPVAAPSVEHSAYAAWIFGGVFAIYLMVIPFVIPEHPSQLVFNIVRTIAAIMGGLFSFFFVGNVVLRGTLAENLVIRGSGGFVVFLFIFMNFGSIAPSPKENAPRVESLRFFLRRGRDDSTIKEAAVVEQGKAKDMGFAPLRDKDDFKLIAKLNHATFWRLYWIDTNGKVTEAATGSSSQIVYPPKVNMFIGIDGADPPGVHVLYLVVGTTEDQKGIKNFVRSVEKLGQPPKQAISFFRGPGMEQSTKYEILEEYLIKLDKALPKGLEAVSAFCLPWKMESS